MGIPLGNGFKYDYNGYLGLTALPNCSLAKHSQDNDGMEPIKQKDNLHPGTHA
jgi:hypothetical protein